MIRLWRPGNRFPWREGPTPEGVEHYQVCFVPTFIAVGMQAQLR